MTRYDHATSLINCHYNMEVYLCIYVKHGVNFFFPSNEFFSVSLFPEGYILLVTYDIPNSLIKVRLLVYRPHSHKKIAQSFYKVCILTGNTAQTSSISSKIAHFIKTLGIFLCE